MNDHYIFCCTIDTHSLNHPGEPATHHDRGTPSTRKMDPWTVYQDHVLHSTITTGDAQKSQFSIFAPSDAQRPVLSLSVSRDFLTGRHGIACRIGCSTKALSTLPAIRMVPHSTHLNYCGISNVHLCLPGLSCHQASRYSCTWYKCHFTMSTNPHRRLINGRCPFRPFLFLHSSSWKESILSHISFFFSPFSSWLVTVHAVEQQSGSLHSTDETLPHSYQTFHSISHLRLNF